MTRIGDTFRRIKAVIIESKSTRSVLLYLFFVVVSTVLWYIMTANNVISLEFKIPINITDVPENVRFLNPTPDTVTVTVQDKGSSFIKWMFSAKPSVNLRFEDYSDANGQFRLDAAHLRRLISSFYSRSATIKSVLPEAVTLRYTDQPGKLVPVELDIDIVPALLYTQNGAVGKSQDSVLVYSDSKTLETITEVYTYHVQLRDLTDTVRRRVAIAPLKGAVVEPRTIELMIPIEKMVTKTQMIDISVRNAPQGVNVVVFPSKVQAVYRTTISGYKMHRGEFTAVVDYNNIDQTKPKVALQLGEVPGAYQDVHLALDSVEYIIETYR